MKSLSVDDLKKNFDSIFNRVQSGESFIIKYNDNQFALIPYEIYKDVDDLIQIYTNHEEGS